MLLEGVAFLSLSQHRASFPLGNEKVVGDNSSSGLVALNCSLNTTFLFCILTSVSYLLKAKGFFEDISIFSAIPGSCAVLQ